MAAQDPRLVELLEVLAGTRPGSTDKAAVRIVDLRELLLLGEVRAKEVAAAPSADEYNALLRDVRELNLRLRAVATVLQKRLLR